MTPEAYNEMDGLRSTQLKVFHKNQDQAYFEELQTEKVTKAAFDFGHSLELLIEEEVYLNNAFSEAVKVYDEKTRNKKVEGDQTEKIKILKSEFDALQKIVSNLLITKPMLQFDLTFKEIYKQSKIEHIIQWEDEKGLLKKAAIDCCWILEKEKYIIPFDFKSFTPKFGRINLTYEIKNWMYWIQDCFYTEGLKYIYPSYTIFPLQFIFCNKSFPNTIEPVCIDLDDRLGNLEKMKSIENRYIKWCMDGKKYKGYKEPRVISCVA